jgi:hypothetical protein
MKIWERAESRKLAVAIDPSRIGGRGYQVEALERVASGFPRLHLVICHLGFPYPGIEKNAADFARWNRMLDLASRENVWFDVSALSAFYQEEGYPFLSAATVLHEFISRYGARKAIWGSDIPGTLVMATYRQLLDMFAHDSRFTGMDLDLLLSRNARTAYHLDGSLLVPQPPLTI